MRGREASRRSQRRRSNSEVAREGPCQSGGVAGLAPMRPLDERSASDELARCLASLDEEQWRMLERYKRTFPIWGGMFGNADTPDKFAAQTGSLDGINLQFPLEQIHYYLRQGHN